jgi:hypothetical protein
MRPHRNISDFGDNKFYDIAISYDSSSQVFIFAASWDRIGGGQDSAELRYRIHPGKTLPPVATVPSVPAGSSVDALITTKSISDSEDSAGEDPPVSDPSKSCATSSPLGWTDPVCWRATIVNQSTNAPGTLTTCTWRWGDGTPDQVFPGSAPECQNGASVFHQYVPQGTGPPKISFTVTLINNPVGPGAGVPSSIVIKRPW